MAALQLTRLTDTDYIMHFDIDLLICDVLSFKIILRDLAVYYKKGTLPDLSWWNFAQYLKDHKLNTAKLREEDEAFWLSKIDSMPNGPKLMLRPGVEKLNIQDLRGAVFIIVPLIGKASKMKLPETDSRWQ